MYILFFYINLVIATVTLGIFVIIIGIFNPRSYYLRYIKQFWGKWLFWSTGLNYEIEGIENLDLSKKYIFISNHESALEIILQLSVLPYNIVFLAKKELFSIPFFGWLMYLSGMISVDRANKDKAIKSINKSIDILKNNNISILLYPEGSRTTNGELKEFKKGGFILAIESNISIVPLTILNAYNLLPSKSLIFKKGTIKMIIDQPIEMNKYTIDDKIELIGHCRNVIKNNKDNYYAKQ